MKSDVLRKIRHDIMKKHLPELKESLGKKFTVKLRNGTYIIGLSKKIHIRK